MQTGLVGKIALNPRGEWLKNANPPYSRLDMVTNGNLLWVAAAQSPNPAQAPGGTNPDWMFSGGLTIPPALLAARTRMTSDVTVYIRTDGDDANTGLEDSPAGAFATWAAVEKFVDDTDFAGHKLTIQFGSGEFDGGLFLSGNRLVGCLSITILGQTDMSTVINNLREDRKYMECFEANGAFADEFTKGTLNENIYAVGVRIGWITWKFTENPTASTNQSSSALAVFSASLGAMVTIVGPMIFNQTGPCAYTEIMDANFGGMIISSAVPLNNGVKFPITINGAQWRYGFNAQWSGQLLFYNVDFVFSGQTISNNVISSSSSLVQFASDVTMSGSVTGYRYSVIVTSAIVTGGKGVNFIPGSLAGVVRDSTSIYY